jgi:6-pyruvoyltetrahydropterin/6-carboxytetrahydropterin synthase
MEGVKGCNPITLKVVKQIRWSMGHRLVKEYPHKCKNAHGHEYLAEIEITGEYLDDFDCVIDFGIIKEEIKSWIDKYLDHGFLCCEQDREMIDFLISTGQKHYVIEDNPTAEVIARLLFKISNELVGSVTKITVWETPDSYAICEG